MSEQMAPGTQVAIVAGPWAGKIGVVETVTVDGVAVRLRAALGDPAREVVVVQPREVAALARERVA